ncbi:hypothetical protein IEQ34_005675 [Dendrobium chrysotoxum]|uniref:Uncharacterized protein n=1 Tax=Dendrobium chrysotoxum TaxID=161865 RepID=A0AAV7HCH2_DENCH|nr:hypothetical protein IEQ34_005675 [Dendrobium chrysotoxum]
MSDRKSLGLLMKKKSSPSSPLGGSEVARASRAWLGFFGQNQVGGKRPLLEPYVRLCFGSYDSIEHNLNL